MGETNVLDYVLADKSDAQKYAGALLACLKSIKSSTEVTHYILARILDVLSSTDVYPNPATLFFDSSISTSTFSSNFLPFTHCLSNKDNWTAKAGGVCVSVILCSALRNEFEGNRETLNKVVDWCCEKMQQDSAGLVAAVPALTVLVKDSKSRLAFGKAGGVGYLTRHLRKGGMMSSGPTAPDKLAAQTLYELGFCLWTMTYSTELSQDFQSNQVVPMLVQLVASAQREKVVRVACASLVNLAKNDDGMGFVQDMIQGGLLKTVKHMKERQWADPDIVEDVAFLSKVLLDNYKDISTWDKYEAEVNSGSLEWGVTHTEQFWRENCKLMETNDFKTLKSLVVLLGSQDDETVCIAAYDIGEWARFYPNGRSLVKKLGGKDVVMKLIDSNNPDIARNALQCVSKIMVVNWEHVH